MSGDQNMNNESDMSDEAAEQDTVEFLQKLQANAEAFDELCQERHEKGQFEYGQFTFLENDVVRMMIEELADTVNYCRYQAIKLLLLQEALELHLAGVGLVPDGQTEITLGVQAFKGTGEVGWGKDKK